MSPRELSNNEWLALGQHFGLSTPLLDWSKSPYISLYFALSGLSFPKSGRHALWAFTVDGFQNLHGNQKNTVTSEELSIKLVTDALCDENKRVLCQAGVFTLTPNGEDVESFIKDNVSLSGHSPVLYKVVISSEHRDDFLRHLEAMNIHSGSLFPDLTGAAGFSNRELEKVKTSLLRKNTNKFIGRLQSVDIFH